MSALDYKTGTSEASLAEITVLNGVYNDHTEKKSFKLESSGTENTPVVSLSEVKKQEESEGTFSKLFFKSLWLLFADISKWAI